VAPAVLGGLATPPTADVVFSAPAEAVFLLSDTVAVFLVSDTVLLLAVVAFPVSADLLGDEGAALDLVVLDEVAVDLIAPADLDVVVVDLADAAVVVVVVDLADAAVAVVVPRAAVSLSVILVAAVDVFLAAAVDVALVAAATDVVLAADVDVVLAAAMDVVVVDLAEEGLLLLLEVVADLAVVAVVVVGFAGVLDVSGFAVVDLIASVARLDTLVSTLVVGFVDAVVFLDVVVIFLKVLAVVVAAVLALADVGLLPGSMPVFVLTVSLLATFDLLTLVLLEVAVGLATSLVLSD